MADSLRQKHLDRTRQAIADAARALFRERGFHATTIDDIAQRADVAPRTFFRYFPSKESLLFAHTEEKLRSARERVLARPAGEAVFETIVAVLRDMATDMSSDNEWSSLVRQLMEEDDNLLHSQRRDMIDEISSVLANALAERAGMKEPDLVLRAVTAATVACVATGLGTWLHAGATGDVIPYVEEALEAVRTAFAST